MQSGCIADEVGVILGRTNIHMELLGIFDSRSVFLREHHFHALIIIAAAQTFGCIEHLAHVKWILLEFIRVFFIEIVQAKKAGQFLGAGENKQRNVPFRSVEGTITDGSIRMLYSIHGLIWNMFSGLFILEDISQTVKMEFIDHS